VAIVCERNWQGFDMTQKRPEPIREENQFVVANALDEIGAALREQGISLSVVRIAWLSRIAAVGSDATTDSIRNESRNGDPATRHMADGIDDLSASMQRRSPGCGAGTGGACTARSASVRSDR
jgi:hypothetical protein